MIRGPCATFDPVCPVGTWTLKITYRASGYVHMSGLSMTLYGTESTPDAVSSIPSQCHSSCARSCSAEGPKGCDACNNLRVASTLECVDECPPGTDLYKSYCVRDLRVLSRACLCLSRSASSVT